jgi:hypothetical protein
VDRVVVTFLIPVREDPVIGSGELHPPFRWKAPQDAVQQSFGGWTAPSAEVHGVWIDPQTNVPVHDTSRVFEVDVDENRLDEIRSLLRRACGTFVQQSIRVVILGKAEYIGRGPDDESI